MSEPSVSYVTGPRGSGPWVYVDTIVVGACEYLCFVGEDAARRIGIDRSSRLRDALDELDRSWARVAQSEAKLSNPGFVGRARPEVVALEERKWADSMALVTAAQNRLGRLLGIGGSDSLPPGDSGGPA